MEGDAAEGILFQLEGPRRILATHPSPPLGTRPRLTQETASIPPGQRGRRCNKSVRSATSPRPDVVGDPTVLLVSGKRGRGRGCLNSLMVGNVPKKRNKLRAGASPRAGGRATTQCPRRSTAAHSPFRAAPSPPGSPQADRPARPREATRGARGGPFVRSAASSRDAGCRRQPDGDGGA